MILNASALMEGGKKATGSPLWPHANSFSFLFLSHSVGPARLAHPGRGPPIQTPVWRLQSLGTASAQHLRRGHCALWTIHCPAHRCGGPALSHCIPQISHHIHLTLPMILPRFSLALHPPALKAHPCHSMQLLIGLPQ